MVTNPAETGAMLPGLEPPTPPAGQLEQSVRKQLDALKSLGYIEDHHEGQCELALATARDIDRSQGKGAPSGRANLLRVMNEILATLPQPETASKDKLDEVVEALLTDDARDDVPEFETS